MPIKCGADRSLEITHAALRYRECGLSCIPLLPFSKRPDYMAVRDSLTFKSLRLARVGTYRRRRASKETLSQWFLRDSNLALVSGYDGMFALDFDDEASYHDWSFAFPSIARKHSHTANPPWLSRVTKVKQSAGLCESSFRRKSLWRHHRWQWLLACGLAFDSS